MNLLPTSFAKCLALVCTLLLISPWADATPATGPVTIEIALPVVVKTDAGLQAEIKLNLAGPKHLDAVVSLYASSTKGAAVTNGLVSKNQLALSRTKQLTLNLPLLEKGDFELRAIAHPTTSGASRSALSYFRWNGSDSITNYTPGEYTILRAKETAEEKPGYGLQATHPYSNKKLGYISSLFTRGSRETADGITLSKPQYIIGEGVTEHQSATNKSESSPDIITLIGNVSTTVNGVLTPLHYTQIDIYDHDPISPDDYLGTTRTDNQGNYNIPVKNNDGIGGGGIDVYLYFHTRRSNVALLYIVSGPEPTPYYYTWRSTTHDNLDQEIETINYSITSNNLASTIWAGASAAVWLTKSSTARDLNYVEVRYPPFGTGTHYRNGIINIDPGHGDSPDTVGHEYGHAVMDQAYKGFPANSGGAHSLCEHAAPGLAWSEGFATWYGVAAWNESSVFTWHIGGNSEDLETWACGDLNASTDEGRTAAWMWDLYDVPKDNNAGNLNRGRNGYSDANVGAEIVGSRTLINTLWNNKQQTPLEYWAALQPRLTAAEKPPSENISKYNYLIAP